MRKLQGERQDFPFLGQDFLLGKGFGVNRQLINHPVRPLSVVGSDEEGMDAVRSLFGMRIPGNDLQRTDRRKHLLMPFPVHIENRTTVFPDKNKMIPSAGDELDSVDVGIPVVADVRPQEIAVAPEEHGSGPQTLRRPVHRKKSPPLPRVGRSHKRLLPLRFVPQGKTPPLKIQISLQGISETCSVSGMNPNARSPDSGRVFRSSADIRIPIPHRPLRKNGTLKRQRKQHIPQKSP